MTAMAGRDHKPVEGGYEYVVVETKCPRHTMKCAAVTHRG